MHFSIGSILAQRTTRLSLIVSLILSLSLAPVPVLAESFGDQSLGWTRDQENAVAGYLTRRLQAEGRIVNDVWVRYWLQERAERLRQTSQTSLNRLTTLAIDDSSFNAFALPGNVMGFHLGLFATAENESEFVSVMAHELAHLSLRHFNRLRQNNQQQGWLALSGLLVGVALIGVDPEMGAAAMTGAQIGALQNTLSFSRSMESEADRLSSRLMSEAGYDPAAGAEVFQRLEKQLSFQPGASDYWQTHPSPGSRVARFASPSSSDNEAPEHHYEALRWYVNDHYLPDNRFAEPPTVYAQLEQQGGDSPLPDTLIPKSDPNLAFGWILYRQTHDSNARQIERLNALLALFPDFEPARYELAQRLVQQGGQCSSALAQLNHIELPALPVLSLRYQLTTECKPKRAVEARADWLWHRGEENKATNIIRRAIEDASDTATLARLRQQLAAFERQRSLLPRN